MAIVTSKGQVTLPKQVREALGLTTGSRLAFDIREGQVVLRRVTPDENFARWQGFLTGVLLEGETVDSRLRKDRGS